MPNSVPMVNLIFGEIPIMHKPGDDMRVVQFIVYAQNDISVTPTIAGFFTCATSATTYFVGEDPSFRIIFKSPMYFLVGEIFFHGNFFLMIDIYELPSFSYINITVSRQLERYGPEPRPTRFGRTT